MYRPAQMSAVPKSGDPALTGLPGLAPSRCSALGFVGLLVYWIREINLRSGVSSPTMSYYRKVQSGVLQATERNTPI